ncbi:EGF-like domain protein [Trichuris suis]|nr:EGF-like domain protein [Trichuris suis]
MEKFHECFTIKKGFVDDNVVDLHEMYADRCNTYPFGELYNFASNTKYITKFRGTLATTYKDRIHDMVFVSGLKLHSDKDLSGGMYNKSYGSLYNHTLGTGQKYFITIGRKRFAYATLESLIEIQEIEASRIKYPLCIFVHYKSSGTFTKHLWQCKISASRLMKRFRGSEFAFACKHPTFTNCIEWDKHYCKCRQGFLGKYCDEVYCSPSTCLHGGTCEAHGSYEFCKCTPGWSGRKCEIKVTSCKDNPCQGQSSCTDVMFYYICHCAPDRTGMNCEEEAGPCRSSPCRNGGVCVAATNAVFSCACKPPYTGDTCESIAKDAATEKTISATFLFASAFVPSMIIATLISLCFIRANTEYGGGKFKSRSGLESGTSRFFRTMNQSVTGRKTGLSFTMTRRMKSGTTTSPKSKTLSKY